MRRAGVLKGLGAAGILAALAACEGFLEPPAGPAPPPARPEAEAPAPPSPASEAIRQYFATQEAALLARGFLRTDGGGDDTPFTTNMLVNNFVRVALYDEYTEVGGRLVQRASPAPLRRWTAPVRMRLEFSPSVPADQRRRDTEDVRAYVARLATLTDHPLTLLDSSASRSAANYHILVFDEDQRRDFGEELQQMVPGIDPLAVRTITNLPRSVSCIVLAFSRGGTNTYSQAVAVIRAELPDLTRLSCYHEELAQGLGLPNDSDQARPSIFNDNEEFALLTRHDELLLRILYDRRLRPGMREDEARPIVRRIASGLLGGES
ncbi:DUF2927 domain-containing protein [Alkalilacustris brevis]|uniref:DUF2927 domain-containing protein n=1 Tax=Alkalilacustris brevis TaxID=2026338 RepID=UPI001EE45DFA|nr:DUF2927 domain-containing protein [Alkalilacustris brevis]